MFASFIYNCIKRDTPLAKGDGKWRLVVKAAEPGALGLRCFPGPGRSQLPGGCCLHQGPAAQGWPVLGGQSRPPSSAWGSGGGRGNPQFRPPLPPLQSAPAHQSSMSTPAHRVAWGRGDLTQRFPWRPEWFLPLHPLLSYPVHPTAPCLNTPASCPPLRKGKSASLPWHLRTSPEPRARPQPTFTLRRHKQAGSLLRDPHTWC